MKLSCIPVCFAPAILREKTITPEDWLSVAVEVGFDGWMSLENLRGGKEELQTGVKNIRNAWDSA